MLSFPGSLRKPKELQYKKGGRPETGHKNVNLRISEYHMQILPFKNEKTTIFRMEFLYLALGFGEYTPIANKIKFNKEQA